MSVLKCPIDNNSVDDTACRVGTKIINALPLIKDNDSKITKLCLYVDPMVLKNGISNLRQHTAILPFGSGRMERDWERY